MRATIGMWVVVAAQAAAGAAWAGSGDGLVVSLGKVDTAWPRWQTRVAVGGDSGLRSPLGAARDAGLNLQAASVVGDYYFARATLIDQTQGGFRATGGLFVGSRFDSVSSALPGPTGAAPASNAYVSPFSSLLAGRYALSGNTGSLEGLTATPYVGVGYTALSGRDGWGFSADLGLMSQGMRLGQSQAFRPGLDETVLRDNRLLSPLLRLGVSYSF